MSAIALEEALNSLPEIGLSQVSKYGPSPNLGFVWDVTFLSNISLIECPQLCLMAETATKNFLNISKSGKLNDLFFVYQQQHQMSVVFFFISFGSNDQQVRVKSNDSAQDLASKLSSLR